MQPTAPAGAFLKAGDFEECFSDLSIEFSQARRLTRKAFGGAITAVPPSSALRLNGRAMHTIAPISEPEMVAVFLQAEIQSARVQQRILPVLQRDGQDRRIVDHPNLNDPRENDYRAQLLGESRGYKQNFRLFKGFPDHIRWERACLEEHDFERIKYINYPYWNQLSQGTRIVAQAAVAIQNGIEVDGRTNLVFWEIADTLLDGVAMPEIILVSLGRGSDLIILEGAHRMTAHFLVPNVHRRQVRVIVGISSQLLDWAFY